MKYGALYIRDARCVRCGAMDGLAHAKEFCTLGERAPCFWCREVCSSLAGGFKAPSANSAEKLESECKGLQSHVDVGAKKLEQYLNAYNRRETIFHVAKAYETLIRAVGGFFESVPLSLRRYAELCVQLYNRVHAEKIVIPAAGGGGCDGASYADGFCKFRRRDPCFWCRELCSSLAGGFSEPSDASRERLDEEYHMINRHCGQSDALLHDYLSVEKRRLYIYHVAVSYGVWVKSAGRSRHCVPVILDEYGRSCAMIYNRVHDDKIRIPASDDDTSADEDESEVSQT